MTIKRGDVATAALKVVTLPGFHVNSDKPGGEYTVPLQLTWEPGPLKPRLIHYPQSEKLKVGNETLNVLSGTFTVQTEFLAPANTPPGAAVITGKLRYQACNNLMCFRPSVTEVRLPVLVE